MKKTQTMSMVLTDEDKAKLLKAQTQMERRTGVKWPLTQIARLALTQFLHRELRKKTA